MTDRPCKECGAPLVWATDPSTGKKIPIDARPVVYRFANGVVEEKLARGTAGVSHFATCPAANAFSRTDATKRLGELLATSETLFARVAAGEELTLGDAATASRIVEEIREFRRRGKWGLTK